MESEGPINYDTLAGVKPTEIGYSIKIGMRSGDMGDQALISKFEVTDDTCGAADDCEEAYKNFGANLLTDRRPDPAIFAYEEQRRPEQFSSSGGIINLHYTGSRNGTSGLPQHPEIFLEETDPDPRGIDPMPQWQELRKQQEARNRFVRFHADADNSITGGGWDPNAARYGSRTTTQRLVKPRLNIFTTEKDGRREGLRREWKHKSDLALIKNYSGAAGRYGELLTDAGLNPLRKSAITSNIILKYTDPSNPLFGMYHRTVTDNEFSVAGYGEDPRKRGLIGTDKSKVIDRTDNKFNAEDPTLVMKAAGLIIGDAVMRKGGNRADIDFNSSIDGQHGRKSQRSTQGMNIAAAPYGYVKVDSAFDDAQYSAVIKNLMPQLMAPTMTLTKEDSTEAAHISYDGQLLGGRVPLPFADLQQIRAGIKRDGAAIQRAEEETARGKMMSIGEVNLAAKRDTHIEVEGESASIPTYKGRADKSMKGAANSKLITMDPTFGKMDNTKMFKSGRSAEDSKLGAATANDIVEDSRGFSDNTQKDRRNRPLGKKYLNREIDRDNSLNESNIVE
jgi:hypothetical protein